MNENPNDSNINQINQANQIGDSADRITIPPDKLMTVSTSPHIKGGETTATIMTAVIIALMPALVWSIYIFGFRALTLTLVSVISCVFFEFLYQKIMKKQVAVKDLSAVVTGILIAFNLPVNTPLWGPVIGAAFAIIIVKQLFGGIGKNIVNPAIAARIFMFLSFNFMASFWDITQNKLPALKINVDAIAGATPLVYLKEGKLPEIILKDDTLIKPINMFLGQKGGCIGEISVLLIIAGGIYLMWRKIISWHTPVSFIAVAALLMFFFPKGSSDNLNFALAQILSGGLFLGAFFMATDYATSPITKAGKLIFGAGCGLITVFIRYFGAYPEGVSFAIMIMNLFVWYIDKATKPVKFGGAAHGRKQ
ncbi:MAG: RnfABCDGE type electron transport complex subunit D [Oscillospiraceae bacterium]|nr:RnfABCDGE type electron transport complex subunit D [Oscillospiraceae bacterium]